MTTVTGHQAGTERGIHAAQLVIALIIGALAGATAAFEFVARQAPTTQSGTPAIVARVDVSTTTASQQYTDWYLRPSTAGRNTTTASQQYTDWYMRTERSRAGATTAGQQYFDWYTRGAAAGSTTASEQYQSWYTRGAVER